MQGLAVRSATMKPKRRYKDLQVNNSLDVLQFTMVDQKKHQNWVTKFLTKIDVKLISFCVKLKTRTHFVLTLPFWIKIDFGKSYSQEIHFRHRNTLTGLYNVHQLKLLILLSTASVSQTLFTELLVVYLQAPELYPVVLNRCWACRAICKMRQDI